MERESGYSDFQEILPEHPKFLRHCEDQIAEKLIAESINFQDLREKMKTEMFQDEKLQKTLARLVVELKDELPEYQTIISDEASGRLVSLLLKKLVDQARNKQEKPDAQIYFVASGRYENKKKTKAIKKFLTEKKEKAGKTLVVTEHIQSGGTMEKLAQLLDSLGYDFNIASASLTLENGFDLSQKYRDLVYYGDDNIKGVESFYSQYLNMGVAKDQSKSPHPFSLFSASQKKVEGAFPKMPRRNKEKIPEMLKEKVVTSREDINTLAAEFGKLLD